MAVYSDIRYGNSGAIGSDFGEALLQTLTASSSSSLSFTTGIDSTFKIYRFRFINIHPSDNATRLKYNFSTDGGSNYNVAKTTIRAALEVGLEEGVAIEADAFAGLFDTEDKEIGVQAFLNRETPEWKHR